MRDSIAEYSDEPLNSGFNLLATGSSLKRFFQNLTTEAEESAKDTPMECINHVKSLDRNILSVSFDTSWSHLRNANQANYNHKPVIAYHVVENLESSGMKL
ncbi:3212_t:CDS:2 [Entrophospora sp. SA101]|nr:3212_t:CDS:2 [Entrophospora sp. SA101]